jgi:hypothetical protein
MSKWTEAPMTAEVKEKLLGTRAARSRLALAAFLAAQPALTYNGIMSALKVAPRASQASNDYARGQMAAKRLLGYENSGRGAPFVPANPTSN